MKLQTIPASLALVILLFTPFSVFADLSSQEEGGRVSGTLACGGNHFTRDGGAELHTTTYSLRNYASEGTITIESVTIYDASGSVIYDSESSGFPAPRSELGPHQSVLFNTGAILAYDLPSDLRPIQTIFKWSASDKAPDLELRVSVTRLARAVSGQERARSDGSCIVLGKSGSRGHSDR
jgi:hypothetical protein